MPRKRDEEPTVSRHIELRKRDWDFLVEHFGPGSATPLGAGAVVRGLVAQKVRALRAALIQHHDEQLPGEAEANAKIASLLEPGLRPTVAAKDLDF